MGGFSTFLNQFCIATDFSQDARYCRFCMNLAIELSLFIYRAFHEIVTEWNYHCFWKIRIRCFEIKSIFIQSPGHIVCAPVNSMTFLKARVRCREKWIMGEGDVMNLIEMSIWEALSKMSIADGFYIARLSTRKKVHIKLYSALVWYNRYTFIIGAKQKIVG